jgi:serine/threonine protein kinase
MIQNHRCCSQTELQDYLHGWSSTDVDSIERHLLECPHCQAAFRELESQNANDGLMDALRQRAQWTANGPKATERATNSSSEIKLPIDEQPDSQVRQLLGEIQDWPVGQAQGPPPITPQHVGQYELLELIGQGGMAHVYRARHGKLQRTVAIKLLNVPAWQVDRSLARLEREIAVVGQLHHPAIVAATDAGQHEGTPYLVTEFIDGLNLSQLARAVPSGTSPKTADACQAIRVAALGLAHAHGQGITHRDIKPSNLMIDRQGHVKILDFGLVHLEGWQDEALELTTVGQLLGTLDYMAPEQADKATAVDHRSDVYALGATLFRLLCGRAPYAASLYQSPLEKLRLLAMTDPPKVATLRPDLPPELAALIDQTLSRNPAHRPPSAAHLAEALLPFCDGAELGAWVQWAVDNPPRPLPTETRGAWSMQRQAAEVPELKSVAIESKGTGRGGRWWKRLSVAAGGAAALWLAIVLILDTQKGQLVIESESADVRVTLRKDGQESETIQLQPGLNQTRIFAGTYQIEIDGPADFYQMDRDTIVIKRGEVVLAKVSRKVMEQDRASTDAMNSEGITGKLPTESSPPTANEPTYSGTIFSEWLQRFRSENNPTEKLEAFKALTSFSGSDQIERTRSVLLEYISLGSPEESILRAAAAIQGFDQSNWKQLQTGLANLPPEKIVKTLSAIRILANPAVALNRGEVPKASSSDRVIPYLDLAEHLLVTTGGDWANEERQETLTGLLELTRLPYRNADDQAKVVTRMWELTKRPEFDHRCWYVVRNDLFWEQFSDARAKIDNAIIDAIPKTYTVSIDFVEKMLALNSIHSRCTAEQMARIAQDLDQLMLSIGPEHLSSKTSYLHFNDDMQRYNVKLFDPSSFGLNRNESNRQTDWETGARLLGTLAEERYRKWDKGHSHFVKYPVVFSDDMQAIVGRSVWRNSQKTIGSWHHLIELVVLSYARFVSRAEPMPVFNGVKHIGLLAAPILEPLCLELSGFGQPGEELVLRTEWEFPESNSSISWGKGTRETFEPIAITQEQLSALLISATIVESKHGGKTTDSVTEPTGVPEPPNDPNQNIPDSPAPPTTTDSTPPLADTALFRGQTYRHWFNVVKNDRDRKTRNEAFEMLLQFRELELVRQTKELVLDEMLKPSPDQNVLRFTFWQRAGKQLPLDEGDWTRLEQALGNIAAEAQVWYLQNMLTRWKLTSVTDAPAREAVRFLTIAQRLAEASATKWTNEDKVSLAKSFLRTVNLDESAATEETDPFIAAFRTVLQISEVDWATLMDSIRNERLDPKSERVATYVNALILRFDQNQDGRLTYEEANGMGNPPPKGVDKDQDGFFSFDELFAHYSTGTF